MAKRQVVKYPGDARIRAGRRNRTEPHRWIRKLQKELRRRGLRGVPLTGKWDPGTKAAVQRFQKRRGLAADGIPGRQTWARLFGPNSVPKGNGGPWPYLWLRPGVMLPKNDRLLRKLNRVGQVGYERHGRRLVIVSGRRTMAQQWHLYRLYRAGRGNLAAYPNPRAPHIASLAVDCGWEGRNGGGYVSFLNVGPWARQAAKREGLCFPVPREPWHAQVGTTWRV